MKNRKTKSVLAIVLSVVMLLSVCPVFSFAGGCPVDEISDKAIAEYAKDHSHEGATVFDPSSFENGVVPEGSYYLAQDVTLTNDLSIKGKVDICLNGKVLNFGGEYGISVIGSEKVLNIYDCDDSAVHKFSKRDDGSYMLDEANGTVSVQGGVITGFDHEFVDGDGGVFYISNSATLNIFKANIVGNRIINKDSVETDENDRFIYIIKLNSATANIYSADISYNYMSSIGSSYGIYAYRNNKLFLGKYVNIKQNCLKSTGHYTSILICTEVGTEATSFATVAENDSPESYYNFGGNLTINGPIIDNIRCRIYTKKDEVTGTVGKTVINGTVSGNYGSTQEFIYCRDSVVEINGDVLNNVTSYLGIININKTGGEIYLNANVSGNTCASRTVNATTGGQLYIGSGASFSNNTLTDTSDPSVLTTDILMRNVGSFVTISEMPTSRFEIKFQKGHPNRYISVAEGLDLEEVLTHLIWDKTQLDYVINEEESRIYIYDHVHDVLITPQVDATCTTDGTTERRVCTKCDMVLLESTVIPATGHPDENIITNYGYRAATCENKGYTGDLYCTKCNTVITPGQEIDATGHRYTKIVGYKAATHFEEGYTGDVYCEICDGFGYYGSVIPKLTGEGIEHADEKINETGEPGHDHLCDGCGEKISECVDEDKNHYCDICGAELSQHYDRTGDHYCDLCGYKMTECEDKDNSHYCDLCGAKLTEHDFVYDSTFAATCTTEGYDIYKCYCGATQTQTIAATGHTEETVDKVEPTCESTGWTAYTKCSVCGATLDDGGHIISALNHPQEYRETVGEKAASCTETGYTGDVVCNLCGETVITGSTINKTPHTRDEVRGYKEATHLEAGYTGDVYCKCGELVEKGEAIAPENHVDEKINGTEIDGHDHLCDTCGTKISQCIDVVKNGTTVEGKDHLCDICQVKLSDCVDENNNHFCDICGELLTKEHTDENSDKACDTCGIVMGGPDGVCYDSENDGNHRCDYCNQLITDEFVCVDNDNNHYCDECGAKISDHIYTTVETAATCTTGAYVTYTCNTCGYTYNTESGEPLGHDYITTVNKAATCTQDGSATVTCSRCDYNEVQTLSAKGHTPAPAVIENVIEPTCTSKGSYDEVIYCSDCSTELNRNTIITPYADHKYTTEVVEPTCVDKGYTIYTCSVCGDTYISDYVDPHGIHRDSDLDNCCDTCGIDMLSLITPDGRCKMCSAYEANKDKPIIGWFYTVIHYFVHLAHSIGNFT